MDANTHAGHGQRQTGQRRNKGKQGLLIGGILLLIVLIIGAIAFSIIRSGTASTIDSSKQQAVFFTNGQVYFGKLSVVNKDYMRLTNVWYLQAKNSQNKTDPQAATAQDASDVELIKLGAEIHGPTDEMVINRDQVLFYENLKTDGKVSQSITNYLKEQSSK